MTDATARGTERLFAGHAGRMLALLALGAMVGSLGQYVFPLLLPTIIDELGISSGAAGFLVTAVWLLTALARYPGGRLADRLSRKTVVVGALALVVAGLAVLVASVGYPTLLLGAVILGAGVGLYFPAELSQISELFVERRGGAMGVHVGAVTIGGAVASGLVVAVLAVAPWRATFLPLIAVLAPVVVLLHRWSEESYALDPSGVSLDLRETATRLLRTPGVPPVVALLATFNVVWQGFLNFLPTFLQVEKGFDPTLSGAAFAAFFVVGAATNPVAGWVSDRLRRPLVAAAMTTGTGIGLAVVVFFDAVPAVVAGVVTFGICGTAVWPVMMAHVMDLVPDGSMGGDFGALSGIYILVGSAGPTYIGLVAERLDYGAAYATLLVGLLVSTLLAAWLSYDG